MPFNLICDRIKTEFIKEEKEKMETNSSFLEKTFSLSERKTNAKTEFLAGLTTFMTMSYILVVNPNMLSET